MVEEHEIKEHQEVEEKKGKGCFSPGCLVVVVAAIALIYYGFVMPGKELPVISLAAELIPIHLPVPGFDHGIPNTLPTAIMTALVLVIIALLYNRAVKRAERTGEESRFLDRFFLLLYPVLELVWFAARYGINRHLG